MNPWDLWPAVFMTAVCVGSAMFATRAARDATHAKFQAAEYRIMTQRMVEGAEKVLREINDRLMRPHAVEFAKPAPKKTDVAVFQTYDPQTRKWVTQSIASGVKYRVVPGGEATK